MSFPLVTTSIFLDTTEFESNSFNFESKKFQALTQQASNGYIQIFITDVVKREVEARIKLHAKEAITDLKNFKKVESFRFIRNVVSEHLKAIFEIDEEKITSKLTKGFHSFVKKAHVNIIPTHNTKVGEILERYFEASAPFNSGNKKYEFPDAISLVTLKNWCKSANSKLYVVSNDKDLRLYCDEQDDLIHVADMNEMLESVLIHNKKAEEVKLQKLQQLFEDNLNLLGLDIGKEFELLELVATNWDLSADFKNTRTKECKVLSFHIISLEKDEVQIEVKCNVEFTAEVSHHDFDTAYYDSEDGVLIPWDKAEYRFSEETEIEAYLAFDIPSTAEELDDWDDIALLDISIRPDTIEIDLDNMSDEQKEDL